MFAFEVGVLFRQKLLRRICQLLAEGAHQGLAQVGYEHGLGAEGGHTGGLCLHLNVRPVVGRQDDDGGIVVQAAYLAGDLDAVHIRQPPVDDIGVVDIAHLDGLPRAQHRFLAGKGPLRPHSHLDQHLCHAVAGVEIVVHHQSLQTLQLGDLFHRAVLCLHPQRHTNDKLAALALRCLHLNGAAHHIHDVFGDGHAKAGALDTADRGGALPLKRLKDFFGKFRAHADAVVLDAELVLPAAAHLPGKLAHPHRDRAARRGKLDGVGQQVQQDLVQPGLIAVDILVGHIHRIHIKLQLFCVDLPADDGFQIVQHLRKVDFHLFQMELSAFDAAHIQHIVDEREQMVAGSKGLGQIILHPLLVVNIADRQCSKADDGVHGGADVVGHIGKEGALGAVGSLGGGNGIRKRLIHLFVGGAVGHDQDVFGPALHLAAYGDVMEPAALFGFQMLKLEIPFPLLPAEKPIQKVFALLRGAQLVQSMDILPDFSPRDAQKPLNVRADVIRLGGFCVQHQKNIVHVQRELLEQFIPVPDLGILPAQGDMASEHNEQNGQHRKTCGDARYDLRRAEPQFVQISIDDADRHKPQHRPALDRRALVDQIIAGVAQFDPQVSAAALCKGIGQIQDLRLGKIGMVAQHRNEVVDRFRAVYGIVDDHPPIRVDDIVAGIALKGRAVQQSHHRIIIIRDGNGIVGKAPVAALRFGTDERQHLGLAGQRRVHDDILIVSELFVQIGLQAKIAGLPGHGHVVAVIGKKVEFGKPSLLLCRPDIRLYFGLIRGSFQKAVVQMQVAHIFAHQLFQHIIGFMQHLFQMRGTFLIDGLGHKRDVPNAETCYQQDQKKDGRNREPLLPGMAVSFGFVLFVFHPAHLSVM